MTWFELDASSIRSSFYSYCYSSVAKNQRFYWTSSSGVKQLFQDFIAQSKQSILLPKSLMAAAVGCIFLVESFICTFYITYVTSQCGPGWGITGWDNSWVLRCWCSGVWVERKYQIWATERVNYQQHPDQGTSSSITTSRREDNAVLKYYLLRVAILLKLNVIAVKKNAIKIKNELVLF